MKELNQKRRRRSQKKKKKKKKRKQLKKNNVQTSITELNGTSTSTLSAALRAIVHSVRNGLQQGIQGGRGVSSLHFIHTQPTPLLSPQSPPGKIGG